MTKRTGPRGDSVNAQRSVGFVNKPSGQVKVIQNYYLPGGAPVVLPPLLPPAQVQELLDTVALVPAAIIDAALHKACRASLGPTASLTVIDDAPTLIGDMLQRPIARQWPPVFECIERFARSPGIDAATVNKLGGWIDACAKHVKPPVSAKTIERMRREVTSEINDAAQADDFSWLQVCLEPDSANRTEQRKIPQFRVELVLWTPSTNGGLTLSTTKNESVTKSWTLDQVPPMLDAVLREKSTMALIPNSLHLVVEIVAPSDVLLYGFDRWKYDNGEVTYGTSLPVVVRLQDRLAIPHALEQRRADERWRAKWNAFANGIRQNSCGLLVWRKRETLTSLDLQNRSDVVCVGISSPLMMDSRSTFDALRDAGIPIAVWMRADDMPPGAPEDWPQRVSDGMNGKRLCELHEAIHDLRRSPEAQNDAKHFFNALTLLWDDPDRPPLKYDAQGVYR